MAEYSKVNLLRLRSVERRTGLSRASIYRLITAGKFPRPIHIDLGDRKRPTSRWTDCGIDKWIQSQITIQIHQQEGFPTSDKNQNKEEAQ